MEKSGLPCIDMLNVKAIPELMSEFGNESVVYSSKVKKFNRFDWTQERSIVITNKKVYNVKKNKVKRIIPVDKIIGVTKSVSEANGDFVFHIKDSYDLRMKSEARDQIIDVIRKVYFVLMGKVLFFYGVKPKNLSEFTTSKKDSKKGLSRVPLEMARIHDQGDASTEEEFQFQADLEFENYTQQMDERRNSYARNYVPTMDIDKEGSQIIQGRQKSSTIYSKSLDEGSTLDDFNILKVIGQGSFGKVYLVQNKTSKKFYGMKSIRKDVVIDAEQLENLRLEKLIMLCVEHPFIISMEYVFQRDFRIYFLMDFIRGGELYRQMALRKRLTEEHAKFYALQVACALGYLHKSKIIYRDLKPENILINEDGYIKLADFGLAKMLGEEVANSFCGTPEYLAPEMIKGTGHDHTLDWWTLGILIYEMIVGIPPFYNQNKHQMYFLVETGALRWPQQDKHGFEVTQEAQDLISKLLTKDKMTRLGRDKDVEEIINHPWFKTINIDDLLAKKIPAMYVPQISKDDDTSHFDEKFSQLEVMESTVDATKQALIEKHKDDFETF